MGLSDIDEDDIPAPTAPPVTTTVMPQPQLNSYTAKGVPAMTQTMNLDALFNDLTLQSDNGKHSAEFVGTSSKEKHAPHSSLDSLFMSSSPNSSLQPSNFASGIPQRNTIYVDHGDTGASDDTDLFDISRPAECYKFNNAESLLDAFEMQGKKGKTKPCDNNYITLKHLTRNKDDNKVTARLLSLMNYYDVLGVSYDATAEVIRRRYKQKALELHPDRVGREQSIEEAELFKVITKAHEVLTDPEKRSKYDRELQNVVYPATPPFDPWH